MRLLGCAMTSPGTIIDYLEMNKTSYELMPIGFKLDPSNEKYEDLKSRIKKAKVILIPTYADFQSNLAELNRKWMASKTVVLFAPVVRFRNIENCTLLDVNSVQITINQPYRFKPVELSALKTPDGFEPVPVKIKNQNYIAELINNALAGSILNKLMTLIYKIPNSKVQNEYRDRIIGWFVKGDDKISTIKALLDDLPNATIRDDLLELVKKSKDYKKVFQHIADLNARGKPISYSKISTKMGVSDFDLRYMISIANSIDFGAKLKEKNLSDHYYEHERNAKKRHAEKPVKPGASADATSKSSTGKRQKPTGKSISIKLRTATKKLKAPKSDGVSGKAKAPAIKRKAGKSK